MKKKRQFKFFFHYNKPASQVAGTPKASVHFRGQCHIVDAVDCKVSTQSKNRKLAPKFVMEGKAGELELESKLDGKLHATLYP